MGMISKIIGAAFAGVGAILVFFGMNDPALSLVYWFIGIIVMSVGFSLITGGRKPAVQEPPPPTVTEIHCDNPECDFKEIRQFEKDDYILKPLKAKCPKCAGTMTIEGVYVVKEDEDAEKDKV
ncbi:MAG: hypothetical protein ACW98Y_05325 [Candidatus Thorarchaeota archaeon]|jgi:hypothetical protein